MANPQKPNRTNPQQSGKNPSTTRVNPQTQRNNPYQQGKSTGNTWGNRAANTRDDE